MAARPTAIMDIINLPLKAARFWTRFAG